MRDFGLPVLQRAFGDGGWTLGFALESTAGLIQAEPLATDSTFSEAKHFCQLSTRHKIVLEQSRNRTSIHGDRRPDFELLNKCAMRVPESQCTRPQRTF